MKAQKMTKDPFNISKAQQAELSPEQLIALDIKPLVCDRWQPIETAPFGETVLLGWRDWRDHQWCMEVGPASHGWRRGGINNVSLHGSATHWMPLPEPPTTAG